MNLSKRSAHIILSILLILGMLSALFLIYEHFVPSASKYCSFGENIDCGIVNKSPYSTLDGISYLLTIDFGLPLPLIDIATLNPVFGLILSNAFLGFLTLLFLFVLLEFRMRGLDLWKIKNDQMKRIMIAILGFGIFYGAYLFFIQHSILQTYCPFCILLDITMILSIITVWRSEI